MDIQPIHNEKEHRAALERLESLMDAEPGTYEGDELEVLAALIGVYEERYYPVDPRPIPSRPSVFEWTSRA